MTEQHIGTAKLKMYIKLTRMTIIICWISLFAFWAVKLFGGNFFEIAVQNENFIKFSDIVQNTWVKYLVSFITIAIAKYLTFGAICQKFYFKGKQLLVVSFAIVSIWAVVNFSNSEFLKMWYAYAVMAIIAISYQKGWKKSFGLLAILFEVVFNVLSVLIRGLELSLNTNYLIIFIGIFDMYIMTALYYLYANLIKMKKEIK